MWVYWYIVFKMLGQSCAPSPPKRLLEKSQYLSTHENTPRVQLTNIPQNPQIEQRYWPGWTQLSGAPAVQALIYVRVCVLKCFSFLKNKGRWKSKGKEHGVDWEAAVWVHKLLLLNRHIWIYQDCCGTKWTLGNCLLSKLWQLSQIISVIC